MLLGALQDVFITQIDLPDDLLPSVRRTTSNMIGCASLTNGFPFARLPTILNLACCARAPITSLPTNIFR